MNESGTARIEIDAMYRLCVNEFLPGPDCHLFNLPAYFRLHTPRGGYYCQLWRQGDAAACAVLHLSETTPGCFRSPLRGTFGGLSARADVPPELLEGFVRAIERQVGGGAAPRFEILLAPAGHDPVLFAKSTDVFNRLGFTASVRDLNFELAVDGRPLAERMESGNRKRLNKCLREGMIARRLEVGEYEKAYAVIVQNRDRRGFPVTMPFDGILKMAGLFGERVRCFAILAGARMVAAAVCIVVQADILYVFYWGDVDGMQQHSPVVMLADFIHDHCRREGIRILDAGTAGSQAAPNPGLARFKRSLGFSESEKLTVVKGGVSGA